MKTTLLIMAAGIGSRFGTGIKQLEPVDYAFQDINDIPGTLPEGRTKPWGTGQAVLAAKKVIKTPFIVINADDYYGKEGFKAVHEYLVNGGKGWKSAIVTWYQKFKESVFFRKLFLLFFVTSMILFRTLLNRNLWMNPLSKVMGGWGIWETVNGEQKLTTECIENVIIMVPFSSVVMWTFKEKTGNGWKKILWYSGKIAFIFSVSIEMLQLLLRLGTFQLSDIFYNTVGGMLGGLVYYVTMKARKHL